MNRSIAKLLFKQTQKSDKDNQSEYLSARSNNNKTSVTIKEIRGSQSHSNHLQKLREIEDRIKNDLGET